MQLLIFNEEFLVSASHQLALTTSLPFVHTARRSYRLNGPVRISDCADAGGSPPVTLSEVFRTLSFRGRRSRNKVSVGEPAEGSLHTRNRGKPSFIRELYHCPLFGSLRSRVIFHSGGEWKAQKFSPALTGGGKRYIFGFTLPYHHAQCITLSMWLSPSIHPIRRILTRFPSMAINRSKKNFGRPDGRFGRTWR